MSRRLDLSGAVAKWYWARHHAYLLKTEIERWSNFKADPPVRFRHEIKPENEYVSFWVESVKPMPPEWPLMLGDICNNYRAALDHVAWQLVQAGKPPTAAGSLQHVYFPFCRTTRNDFLSTTCRLRLPNVSRRRCLQFSPLQPYKRRVNQGAWKGRHHPSLVLPDINREDKHKELVLLLHRPDMWHVSSSHYPVHIQPLNPGQSFQANTEAVRVWFLPRDYSRMTVEFDASSTISLSQWGSVVSALEGIDWLVQVVLRIFRGIDAKDMIGLQPAAGGTWPHLDHFPGRLTRDGWSWR